MGGGFEGLRRVRRGRRGGRRRHIGRGRIQSHLQLCEQGIEHRRDLLLGGFHGPRASALADEFLQRTGGGLDGLRTEIAGHALERVSKAFGQRHVALGQRAGNLPYRRALLLDELAEEFQIEFPIARDPAQAVFRVEASNGWNIFNRRRRFGAPTLSRGRPGRD